MAKSGSAGPSYEQARLENLRRSTCVRVFGIPAKSVDESHVTILWSGIAIDGVEQREKTSRIWHIDRSDVVDSGDAGNGEKWFDVAKDATPVEEVYVPVSLVHMARMRVGGRFGRLGEVPISLDPHTTKIPSTPPLTLDP